jgi:hypothetical protein
MPARIGADCGCHEGSAGHRAVAHRRWRSALRPGRDRWRRTHVPAGFAWAAEADAFRPSLKPRRERDGSRRASRLALRRLHPREAKPSRTLVQRRRLPASAGGEWSRTPGATQGNHPALSSAGLHRHHCHLRRCRLATLSADDGGPRPHPARGRSPYPHHHLTDLFGALASVAAVTLSSHCRMGAATNCRRRFRP